MQIVNITSAKANLSSLLKKVGEQSEDIIIKRAGKPIARIVKYTKTNTKNRLGIFKDKISVKDDFD